MTCENIGALRKHPTTILSFQCRLVVTWGFGLTGLVAHRASRPAEGWASLRFRHGRISEDADGNPCQFVVTDGICDHLFDGTTDPVNVAARDDFSMLRDPRSLPIRRIDDNAIRTATSF